MERQEYLMIKDMIDAHAKYIDDKVDSLERQIDRVCQKVDNNITALTNKINAKTRWYSPLIFIGSAIGGFLALMGKFGFDKWFK
jgi:hypothetical protein